MAIAVKRKTTKNIGTAYVRIGNYTVPAATSTVVIGLTISNIANIAVSCTVAFSNSTANTMLAVNTVIPVGSAFVPVGRDQKLVLQTGDGILVAANSANGLDAIMSILEKT